MKERMNWIDALRGFTMFCVVLVHVLGQTLGINTANSVLIVLRGTFTLPLFFLISGFFLYRPEMYWDFGKVRKAVRIRFVAMIVGAIVFYSAYYIMNHPKMVVQGLLYGEVGKYWFTPALFQMFCCYLILVGVSRICRRSLIIPFFILTIAANIVMQMIPALNDAYWCSWAMSKKTVIYLQFFSFGLIARKYEKGFMKFVMQPYVLTACLLCVIGGTALLIAARTSHEGRIPMWVAENLYDYLSRFGGAMLVLNIFYYNREYFNGSGRFVTCWRKVGTRTLDIYYFHYFLLPHLRWIHPYISKGNTFLPELILGAFFAIIVMILCMGLSNVVRRAPLLRNLVGAKGPVPGGLTASSC